MDGVEARITRNINSNQFWRVADKVEPRFDAPDADTAGRINVDILDNQRQRNRPFVGRNPFAFAAMSSPNPLRECRLP